MLKSYRMMLGALILLTLLMDALPLPNAVAGGDDQVNVNTMEQPITTGVPQDGASLSQDELAVFRQQALEAFRLQDADLLQIEDLSGLTDAAIPIRLDQEQRTMRLYPYSLRSPDFVVLVPDEHGNLVETPPPAPATYRGGIDEDPGSQVAASKFGGQLHALILGGNGEQWAIEPVKPVLPSAPPALHVVYRASDVIAGGESCGVDAALFPGQPVGQDEQSESNPVPHGLIQGRTEIAFDADFEFYMANGGSVDMTVQDIELVMNQVGLIYQNQVDICYALTGVLVWSSEPDPYNATNDGALLCEFTDFWNSVVPIQRDVAHLMTGKDVTSTTAGSGAVGLAWIGVICDAVFTNCNGGVLHYGLSESRFSTNLTQRTILTAHELGHNWSACHCNQSSCTGGAADADCGIMCSSVGCASTTFGDRALVAITAHRDSRACLGFCWDPVYVKSDAPPGGNGSTPTTAFDTVEEGVNYATVGGTVIILPGTTGNYPETLTINKAITLEAQGGSVTIGN